MVSITVQSRSGKPSKRFPITLDLGAAPTVRELKAALQKSAKIGAERQRLTTVDKKVLDDDTKPLSDYGLKSGDDVQVKDLGPQISWRTVFIIEYLGPILIHPAVYFSRKLLYGVDFEASKMQKLALGLVVAHYVKREVETIFVHRFSSATMPAFNLVKNSTHYWLLSGALLAYPLYAPSSGAKALSGTLLDNDKYLAGCAAVWAFAQLSNAVTHLNLRSLRSPGTKERKIPRGYGFSLVSCPNYFFESIGWGVYTALTLNWAAGVFFAVGTAQMMAWAVKKHQRYKKEFGKEYPRRKAMFPFVF